jgi:hypothetical protein
MMHSLFDWVVVVIAAVWLGIVFLVIIKKMFSEEGLFSGSFWEIHKRLKLDEWWSKYLILGTMYLSAMEWADQWGETTGYQFLCYGIPAFAVLLLAFIINDFIEYIIKISK